MATSTHNWILCCHSSSSSHFPVWKEHSKMWFSIPNNVWVHPRKAQQFFTVYYKVTQLSFSGYTVAYFTGHKMCSSCLGVHRSICLPVCLPSCMSVSLSHMHSKTEFSSSCLPEVTLLIHAESVAHISDLAFLDSFPTAVTKLQSVYRFNQTEAVLAQGLLAIVM